jgi:hypothetical protein
MFKYLDTLLLILSTWVFHLASLIIATLKYWNNFNWKLPELLQAYVFLQKPKCYVERQVENYYL